MDFGQWLLASNDDANTSVHMDPKSISEDFETWFLANGGHIHPSIELASSPVDGHFLRVEYEQTIPAASTIVSCPHSLALSWPSAHKFHYPDIKTPICSQHVATRFFLMKQKLLEKKSPWWPYLAMLPESFNTPMYYEMEDLAWIRGTNLGNGKRVREIAWRGEYEQARLNLFPQGSECELRETWTWFVPVSSAIVNG